MGLIGDVFTAVAAVAAVVALVYARRTVIVAQAARKEADAAAEEAATYARQTVDLAKTAREEADAAAKEAAADRRRAANQAAAERVEADYRNMIERVGRVGEIVEDLFWQAQSGPSVSHPEMRGWMAERNRLGVALVGFTDMLPRCAEILNAASREAAFGLAAAARQEVLVRLTELHGELLTYQRAVRADALPTGATAPAD